MTTPLARAMVEDQLMENIRGLVKLLRLYAFHVHDARKCWGPGYPDLTICGPCGVIFRECKTEHGTVRPEQTAWIYALKAAGQNADVWRPRDWFSGKIERELRLLAGQPQLPLAA
jgi:hypothetical protein